MKFVPYRPCSGGGNGVVRRMGELCVGEGTTGKYTTPMCLTYTRCGSVPHLTADVLKQYNITPNTVLLLDLSTMYPLVSGALKSSKQRLNAFLGVEKERVFFLSVQDAGKQSPAGFNVNKATCVRTRSGNQKLTSDDYVEIIKTVGVQNVIYQSLCDSDSGEWAQQSRKRVQKSVNRTLRFLDEILEKSGSESSHEPMPALVGCVEGGFMTAERRQSAQQTAAHTELSGFALEGFNAYGSEVPDCAFERVLEQVDASVSELPADKVRILLGCWSPIQIISCVERGVDLFDSSYTYLMTEAGRALTFPTTQSQDTTTTTSLLYIDLWDKIYADDLTPVTHDCQCPTCAGYTKAYLHHLLVTKELLARVLLMGHNLFKYQEFFQEVRRTLETPESWNQFKAQIKSSTFRTLSDSRKSIKEK